MFQGFSSLDVFGQMPLISTLCILVASLFFFRVARENSGKDKCKNREAVLSI